MNYKYGEQTLRILFWFTSDLRLDDNLGLIEAATKAISNANNSINVLPLYILDDTSNWPVQGASAWWLHYSLQNLQKRLNDLGGRLVLRSGNPLEHLTEIAKDYKADGIYFSRSYEKHGIKLQEKLHTWCNKNNIECKRFRGNLLLEPEQSKTKQDNYYQVFTPFYKNGLKLEKRKIKSLGNKHFSSNNIKSLKLKDLQLLPKLPNWAENFHEYWSPGEENAHQVLKTVINDTVKDYGEQRDFPSIEGTSRLSAHLHFGELSATQIWETVQKQMPFEEAETFLRQLCWRDFNAHLLFHEPHIDEKVFKEKFAHFPWKKNPSNLKKWQKGQTGYPIVDAGMRQLWHTGWMHNRIRMVVASFLTKDLGIHWLEGARWFWDTLVDADIANNSGGWQWVAGCGADAAPYFRIFNPVSQSEKFDKKGEYIRQWVPELKNLPDKYIHKPWEAPQDILDAHKIKLGEHYPKPMINHKEARLWALDAYKNLN